LFLFRKISPTFFKKPTPVYKNTTMTGLPPKPPANQRSIRNQIKIFVVIIAFVPLGIGVFYFTYMLPNFQGSVIENSKNIALLTARHLLYENNFFQVPFDESIPDSIVKKLDDHQHNFNLWKIRLFNPEGTIVFSTRTEEIGTVTKSAVFYNRVIKGNDFAKMVSKGSETGSSGTALIDVVETYIPIISTDGSIHGAFEIYVDATKMMDNLHSLFYRSLAVVFFVLVLLLGTIFFIAARLLKDENKMTNLIKKLQTALEEIKTLQNIIPMCASCKKIRDDEGYWQQVETYISAHTDSNISHGICPDCLKKIDPEYYDKMVEKGSIERT